MRASAAEVPGANSSAQALAAVENIPRAKAEQQVRYSALVGLVSQPPGDGSVLGLIHWTAAFDHSAEIRVLDQQAPSS